MFTSLAYVKKHTPENGTDRESYLSLLVDEYINSDSYDAKCQVLANLANFAYDPLNFGFIRDVGVLDIFLHVIKNESDSKLLLFATSGICNLSPDPLNAAYLLKQGADIQLQELLLNSQQVEVISDVIATFISLYEDKSFKITNSDVINKVQILKESNNKVISNLATILLDQVFKN